MSFYNQKINSHWARWGCQGWNCSTSVPSAVVKVPAAHRLRRTMLLNACTMRQEGSDERILLSIEDISERERARSQLEAQKEYADKIVDASREALLILGWDLRVKRANQTFYDTFKVDPADTEGRLVYELGNGQWNIPRLRTLLEDVLPGNAAFNDFEVDHQFETVGRKTMLLNARRIDHMELIVLAIEDETPARQAAARIRTTEARLLAAFESVPAGLAVIDSAGNVIFANREYLRFIPSGIIPSRDPEQRGHWRAWDAGGRLLDESDYPAARALRGETVVPGQEMLYIVDEGREVWTNVATAPTLDDRGRVTGCVSVITDISERKAAEAALRQSETHLETELRYATLLQELASRTVTQDSITSLYDEILATAVVMMKSDAGTLQVYDPKSRSLVLLATQGIARDMADHFHQVDASSNTACGAALRTGQRTFVDFASDLGDEACRFHVNAGLRSAQATPLLSRDGAPIGMLNTHWQHAQHRPTHDQLRFLDLLSRQAADLIEQRQAQDRLRESEVRYRELFERIDEGFCIVEMIFEGDKAVDYLFLEVNPAFERHTGIPDAAGRRMRDIAPDHEEHWFKYYGEIALTGQSLRFEAPAKQLGDRWYDVHAFRVGEADQRRVAIVFSDVTKRQRNAKALRQSEERLRRFGEASQDVLWIRDAETLAWIYLTPAFEEIFGITREAAIAGNNFENWMRLIVAEDRERARSMIDRVRGGEHVTFEYRICRPCDGQTRWLRDTDFPIRSDSGRIISVGGICQDISSVKAAEERQKVLVAELQHRTRNLMGVVRSMAESTARTSVDFPDFRERYRDRLAALARVQGLLSRLNEHDRVTFDELVRTELSAMGAGFDRVLVEGPMGIRLRSSTVQTLALAIHELATNASKYGALAQPSGRLKIQWTSEPTGSSDRPWLHIDWLETGVTMPPAGAPPQGSGQGRELIEKALPYQLGAKTSYTFRPDGVHCTISIPVSATACDNE